MIRVFLIEPLTVFREALGVVLEGQPDMQIIGEAGSAADAIQAIRLSGTAEMMVVVGLDGGGPGKSFRACGGSSRSSRRSPSSRRRPPPTTSSSPTRCISGADSFVPQDRESAS